MDIFQKRFNKFKNSILKKDYSLFIIQKKENIFYLTGFWGEDGASMLILGENKSYLLVHFIYHKVAKQEIDNPDIELIEYQTDRIKSFSKIIKNLDVKNIALEDTGLSYQDYVKIKEVMDHKEIGLNIKSGLVEKQRLIKDEFELENLEQACRFSDMVYDSLLELRPGFFYNQTETLLYLEMEKRIYEYGGHRKSFDFIVANNQASALPHYNAQNKLIKPGIILLDYGVEYNHYHADITRTFFVDMKKENKFKKIYDIVLQAQSLAIKNCRPGIKGSQLDKIARDFISSAGYGPNFGHGLGHGVGLEIHEGPMVGRNSNDILKEGMVLTIEPGIYLEGLGGVRIEDTVLIEKNGCRLLTNCSKAYKNLTG